MILFTIRRIHGTALRYNKGLYQSSDIYEIYSVIHMYVTSCKLLIFFAGEKESLSSESERPKRRGEQ